jgi:signal transduction histidine kinase
MARHLTRTIRRRISSFSDAAKRFGRGDLSYRVASSDPDLQSLVAAFNQMAQDVEESADQLRQAQKMDAIGQLAGGIAHDFNNLLAVIKSYASLAADQLERSSPVRVDLDEVIAASDRAAQLTHQLLTFSRGGLVTRSELLNLNSVVQEATNLLARTIPRKVSIRRRLSEDLPKVRADGSQMHQVVMNLVMNAAQAMPDGGEVEVTTRGCSFVEVVRLATGKLDPGGYVCVEVHDTGAGISADDKTKIFEPFFTTKPEGKGTGLGLSVVYRIVQEAGGQIDVRSLVGTGTSFAVYLPTAAERTVHLSPLSTLPHG